MKVLQFGMSNFAENEIPMFEGTSIQFVVDAEEVREELKAGGLNWPVIKILGDDKQGDQDPEDLSVSNTGVAIYIDSIDLILKERIDKAKEIVATVARVIQYFNERDETAVLFFHKSWETYLLDDK